MGTLIRTGGDWNWLTELPEEVFAAIDAHCVPLQLRAGENVYRREEASDALFQVVKGRVRIRNYSASGKELLYTYMEPGDCFGELGLIDGESRHHDVDADGEAELAVLSSTDFSRQSVTSILKNWERQGLLRQEYGKIVLLDLDAFRQFAES